MNTLITLIRTSILSLIAISALAPHFVQAHISPYDSMYFPTTQSLEGTRGGTRIYDLVTLEFGANADKKPTYFKNIKETYASELVVDLNAFEASTSMFDKTMFKASNQSSDLASLHSRALERLTPSSEKAILRLDMTSSIESLDAVDASSFDFRNAKKVTQAVSIASLN